MAKKFYITTAIDYVNSRPHIGHAFEKVIADAIVRWKKLQGKKTYYLTGTDENAQKNAQAAKEEGIPVKKFVDRNSKIFLELCNKLNLAYDDFIRTTEERHVKTARKIFKQVYDKGEMYKGKYEGFYCYGCEAFKTEKDLIDGKCPEHNKKVELISEEGYFFKLSKYKDKIIKFIESYIVPETRKNEILSRLQNGELKDLYVSRKNLDWGITSPIDKSYKIYVWFDALINYISGADGNWPADVHVVGKGINWFHSVIWPAILISAGYELPKTLLVHGYINLKGQKISKTFGNTIDPLNLIEKYGVDSVRYSLFRCSIFEDSDYSEEILVERHNNELANKLGNLISRVSNLIEKNGVEKTENKIKLEKRLKKSIEKGEAELRVNDEGCLCIFRKYSGAKKGQVSEINDIAFLSEHPNEWIEAIGLFVKKYMEEYQFDKALNTIFSFIDHCNWYVQIKKPWETKNKKVLYELKESILNISELLWPFIPGTSEKITSLFSAKNIKKPQILFKKI